MTNQSSDACFDFPHGFAALVTEVSPWIKSGRSNNRTQNVSVKANIALAWYFMAHGGNGFTLGVAAGLNNNTVLRHLLEVSDLIAVKLKDRWIGYGIFEQSPTYMEDNRARFHLRDFLWLVLLKKP